jgi:hypothetical protein
MGVRRTGENGKWDGVTDEWDRGRGKEVGK